MKGIAILHLHVEFVDGIEERLEFLRRHIEVLGLQHHRLPAVHRLLTRGVLYNGSGHGSFERTIAGILGGLRVLFEQASLQTAELIGVVANDSSQIGGEFAARLSKNGSG